MIKHAADWARPRNGGGEPLPAPYRSFLASVMNRGANQVFFKAGRQALPIPQVPIPGLDTLGYEPLPVLRSQ